MLKSELKYLKLITTSIKPTIAIAGVLFGAVLT
jgi:hypothetical protein